MRRLQLVWGHRAPRLLTIVLVVLLLGAGGRGFAHESATPDTAEASTVPIEAFAATPPIMQTSPAPRTASSGRTAPVKLPSCAGTHVQSVSTVPKGVAAPGPADVVVDTLNVRAGPSTACPILATLDRGTQVTIHSGLLKGGGYYWRRVTTPNGDGYTIADAYQHVASTKPAFVPILMYHHIEAGTDNLHVPPATFEQQLAWLKDHGYVSILPDQLDQALYHGRRLPAKPIMLTIDDGNPSTLTFKALLDKYGFRGVYFLPNYAHQTPAQIKALDRSGAVCAHTVTHQFLNQLSYADQDREITANQQWLAKIVGHKVRCFAYPFGAYDANTEAILKRDGFTLAFNATGGACPLDPHDDPYHIPRKEIDPIFDITTFAQIVTLGW